MRQYRFSSRDFVPEEQVPDAVLSAEDLRNLQVLAGVQPVNVVIPEAEINISHTGTEHARLQRELKIEPGTPEWFRLWFALPHLSGEKPTDRQ